MWHYQGERRPEFAETPGPGEESVWDYPRRHELSLIRGGSWSAPATS
jgi:hypothetical protein